VEHGGEEPMEASAVAWSWVAGARRAGRDGGGGASDDQEALEAQEALRARAARLEQAAAARRQGWIGGAVGLAVAAVFALLLHRRGAGAVVASVSVLITVIALAAPLTLFRRLRALMELFGHAVGTAVTWVLMTVLFYLLFLPVGLLLRATGKLGFTRFADPRRSSYWTTTGASARAAASYRKQF
jgi:hypothetical protein